MAGAHDPDTSVYADPRDWPADVQALADAAQCQNVQFGGLWYRNLIDTVFSVDPAHRPGVHFHVRRKNGRAVAMIPLRVATSGGARRAESLSNFYTCLYAPALAEGLAGDDLVPLIEAIVRTHAPLASLRIAPMDPESTGYRLLMAGLARAGLKPFSFFCFGNWYLSVAQDWASYLKAREGMLRSTLKRMGKRFAADAGTLEIISGSDRLAAGLAAYQQVYAASWKNAEPFPDFMPGLVRLCADKGWLRLGVAWLDGRAIAAQVWIVANGRAEIYKLAYDEAFKSYSPGSLLTALLMQHVFEQDKVVEVDYLIGDDPYKKAWMTERRERWGIIAFNPATIAGRLALWREQIGRRVKPLIQPLIARWKARVRRPAAS
jgi:CelD/BcsL family acetyltransferase involved in cellulose biosynthesis